MLRNVAKLHILYWSLTGWTYKSNNKKIYTKKKQSKGDLRALLSPFGKHNKISNLDIYEQGTLYVYMYTIYGLVWFDFDVYQPTYLF